MGAKAKSKGRTAQEPARRNVCWDEARGKGTCTRGDACRFSHDPQAIKEFIKGKGKGAETHAQENDLAKAAGKGRRRKKGEPKAKAKAKAQAGAGRVKFPDKLCFDIQKGRECSKGKDCEYSHDR